MSSKHGRAVTRGTELAISPHHAREMIPLGAGFYTSEACIGPQASEAYY